MVMKLHGNWSRSVSTLNILLQVVLQQHAHIIVLQIKSRVEAFHATLRPTLHGGGGKLPPGYYYIGEFLPTLFHGSIYTSKKLTDLDSGTITLKFPKRIVAEDLDYIQAPPV